MYEIIKGYLFVENRYKKIYWLIKGFMVKFYSDDFKIFSYRRYGWKVFGSKIYIK